MSAVIVLYVPGATSEQIEHGIQVALAVLEKHEVTPERAREAFDYRRRWNSNPTLESSPSHDVMNAWITYDAARRAAIEACREDANEDPDCVFEIVVDPVPH